MFWVIILVIIALIFYTVYKGEEKEEIPKINVSISTDTNTQENLYTGELLYLEDGGFVLNANTIFPLTIYGVDFKIASEIKKILDGERGTLMGCQCVLVEKNIHFQMI